MLVLRRPPLPAALEEAVSLGRRLPHRAQLHRRQRRGRRRREQQQQQQRKPLYTRRRSGNRPQRNNQSIVTRKTMRACLRAPGIHTGT